jgi:cystathionine beta-lyase/cystathionine gamma-synthase
MHSATKYLAGHSDVMAGFDYEKEELGTQTFQQFATGRYWDLWIAFSA